MPLRWFVAAIGCEGTPLLYADRAAYRKWHGTDERAGTSDYQRAVLDEGFDMPTELVAFDGVVVGLLDSEGDMAFDIGCDEREVIVLAHFADEDDPKHADRIRAAVAKRKFPEYLVGELELSAEGLILANSADSSSSVGDTLPNEPGKLAKNQFFVPLPAGGYTVLEGRDEDDSSTPWWCRIQPTAKKKYRKRPEAPKRDPVADIMERVSFNDAKGEARALEAALELIALGRSDLALSLCARASADRRHLATFTRILALAATGDSLARTEATSLAEAWLAPADSTSAANQTLTRVQVLRALDAASVAPELRARVASAPEPDVFVTGGDDFF